MQESWQEARAILRLGAPLIAAQLAQVSMNFVDTVMAGNLNPQGLAAVALGGSLWMPLVVFNIGLLMAVSPSVSFLYGARRYAEIGPFVRQGLWVSQGVAIVCFLLIREAAPVLHLFHIDPEIIPTAAGYLDAISWGIPAFCAYSVLRCYSEGVSVTSPMMFISLAGLGANIGGNYVFMYGWDWIGLPAFGAVGCGWASALVMWVMLFLMLAYIGLHPQYRRYELFQRFDWLHPREIFGILKLGLPIGASMFMEGSSFATVALMIGTMGTTAVAGHQVALNFASVTFMVPLGISMAISVRVGQALGRGDQHDVRRAGRVGMLLAVGFMVCSAIVMAAFPEAIASLYTKDAKVQSVAVSLLYMAAIFQISDGLQVAGAGALRGLKDTQATMLITFLAYWGIGLPLGYILGIELALGPQAMWVGLIVGLTFAGILLNFRFHRVSGRLLAAGRTVEVSPPSEVPCEVSL